MRGGSIGYNDGTITVYLIMVNGHRNVLDCGFQTITSTVVILPRIAVVCAINIALVWDDGGTIVSQIV